jgi:DNA-binding transcriptional LysR family regulator
LSQSTVSHRLKVLEHELDSPLVERHRGERSISLTPFGEEFVTMADRWTTLYRETHQMKSHNQRLSLAIGAVNSVNTYILPPLYLALRQHPTPISLRVCCHHSWELYNLIERREIDVAFTLQEFRVPTIVVEPFFTERIVVLRMVDDQTQSAGTVSPEELNPEDELFISWGPTYTIWHDRMWDPLCSSRLVLDTASMIPTLLTEPKHWALVPASVARALMGSGGYRTQELAGEKPTRTCYMLSHKYKRPSTVKALAILNELTQSIVKPLLENHE